MEYVEWKELHKLQLNTFKGMVSLKYTPKDLPLYWLLGDEGNIKIPVTTAIFNMSSAKNCPSMKLGLCKAEKQGAHCYARKAEYMYPPTLPYRNRQGKLWGKISAKEFAFQFLVVNAYKKNPFNKLRLNESGDFYNQDSVNKAEKIARILKKYGVITYCYTSRDDLDFSKVWALRVSGSGFKKEGIVNVFKIINNKKDRPRGYAMCGMSCKICDRCSRAGLMTCVVRH